MKKQLSYAIATVICLGVSTVITTNVSAQTDEIQDTKLNQGKEQIEETTNLSARRCLYIPGWGWWC